MDYSDETPQKPFFLKAIILAFVGLFVIIGVIGLVLPIIPGILPVEKWEGTQRFAKQCGASIPQVVQGAFENATRDGTTDLLATAIATELCDDLLRGGVDHLHFYTLNRPELTRDICHAFGVTPKVRLQNVA